MILHGNCLDELKKLDANSVDAIVTDPPYGLKFMGKKWDYEVPSTEIWQEALRVLKPGGHLLAFSGTRTYHRMVVNIDDAGFEIRDQIQWLYGSGFPKSHDISKAIDKAAVAEREVIGEAKRSGSNSRAYQSEDKTTAGQHFETAPATDEAKQWQGWGTALKPANEPICVARKPLEKGLTVAENVLKYGTGALNIDGSRIGLDGSENLDARQTTTKLSKEKFFDTETREFKGQQTYNPQGRWPANVMLDEAAAELLDEQSGTSRFFYVAKASKRERGAENNHPTVKPIKLMEYLIKLVTPPKGTVLDPFMGSGTTGIAAKQTGFKFIGIEMNQDYLKIAEKRIEMAKEG